MTSASCGVLGDVQRATRAHPKGFYHHLSRQQGIVVRVISGGACVAGLLRVLFDGEVGVVWASCKEMDSVALGRGSGRGWLEGTLRRAPEDISRKVRMVDVEFDPAKRGEAVSKAVAWRADLFASHLGNRCSAQLLKS